MFDLITGRSCSTASPPPFVLTVTFNFSVQK